MLNLAIKFYAEIIYSGCPKKLHLILRLYLVAVGFSMTKMLVLSDSRDMYKSFGT